jgi:2-hydroxy-6-oxonona-2,4-dienedioate hydrolase
MLTAVRVLAGLGAAMAGGALLGAYRRDITEHRERVRGGGRIAQTRLGPVEYAVAGSGPPALVIHGAGGGYDQGLLLGQNIPGFQVIAPSRFGYLGTPTPQDISPAAQADAHAALLDTLGIERAVVAGISAGAPSAVQMALRHPERVRALILIVPRGYAPGQPVEAPATHAGMMRVVMSGADFAYWAAMRIARNKVVQFVGVPPEVEACATPVERERVDEVISSILPLSMRIEGLRNDSAITLGPLPLERIQAPTLIVSARDDLFRTLPAAEHLAERIPGARLVVLDTGGHLCVGRQGEVNGAITDLLADVAAAEGKVQPLRKSA